MTTRYSVASVCALFTFLGSAAISLPAQGNVSLPRVQNVTLAQAEKTFADPPSDYGPNIYFEWNDMTGKSIDQQLDQVKELGFRAVTFQASRTMSVPYLSDAYFSLVQNFVQAAAARDLRVWIVDDGGYPSGFAGGKFTREAPTLGMQGLAVYQTISVTPGTEFEDVVPPSVVSAVAFNVRTGQKVPLAVEHSRVQFRPASGDWQVVIAEHRYESSSTISITSPSGLKDQTQSLENYLEGSATSKFIDFEHNRYKAAVGEYFGTVILGFRGDEPDFSISGLPYTPGIFALFREQEGYDIQPEIASLLLPDSDAKQNRLLADYTDVWSRLFRDNFFRIQSDWCAKNHLSYQVHLNHEDDLPRLAVTEGDFLRDMTVVQIPGVDTIWHQIWKDAAPDFPLLAASAAHLGGHAQAFTESFAAYRPEPTLEDARFILNEQIARGINLLEIMHYPIGQRSPFHDPAWPVLMREMRRTTALLSQGIPEDEVAVFLPSASLWMRDYDANASTLSIEKVLGQQQMSFDLVDDDTFCNGLDLVQSGLRNASGNTYRALIIPSRSVLSALATSRLERFSLKGGLVIIVDKDPLATQGQSFSDLRLAHLPNAVHVRMQDLAVLIRGQLSRRTPQVEGVHKELRTIHRRLEDGEVFYVFNEGNTKLSTQLRVPEAGVFEQWNPDDGTRLLLPSSNTQSRSTVNIHLLPYEAKILVLRLALTR